ncbi:MAG TPA: pyruvate formate lyase family protein, partial [bacterium]|nr:pyruvate formate lyase family protein [bacterium]
MNDRVRRLREASMQATPSLSTERAEIVTRVYSEAGLLSAPMLRARIFEAIMAEKTICINPGELIVGER